MKTKTILSLFFSGLLFSIATSTSFGQIGIDNIKEVEKFKKGTTYVAMYNPNSPRVTEYIKAFKDAWALSKLEFIRYSEIENHLAPENSFFTMGGYETTTENFVDLNGIRRKTGEYSNTHLYLELWTPSEKYFTENKKKALREKDKIQIARIELYTDFETLKDPQTIYQMDYDGLGHIRNWGPGMLKNYLQALTSFLNKSEKHFIASKIYNEQELEKLKTSTLYVPDYVLVKFNMFTGDESKQHKEEDLFEDYKLKYQLVSTKKLNDNIVNDPSGFYYLLYVKSSTDKFVSVINSRTGEIIYSDYTPVKYNLKPGDLKDLYKKIMKI
jgi:hypothetical protein